jgi:hypothetical protein
MSLQERPVIGCSADCWPSGLSALRRAIHVQASGLLPADSHDRIRRGVQDADRRVRRLQRRGGPYAQVRASGWVDALRAALDANRLGLAAATDGDPRLAYTLPRAG